MNDIGTTLLDRFRYGVATNPDGTALRCGPHAVTYRELDGQARELAGAILRRHAAPDRVGVLAVRGRPAYTAMLAAMYAGATMVPLNPDFPAARTGMMAEAARLDVLVAGEGLGQELPVPLRTVPVVPATEAGPPVLVPKPRGADDVAYILFTSGSTGRPKGVPIRHRNVLHYLEVIGRRYALGPADVVSQTFDLTFDLSVFDMFVAWGAGATLVTVPPTAMLDLPEFLGRHGVTVWFSAPSVVSLQRRGRGLPAGALHTLRWSLFCGEALMRDDAEDWQRAAANSVVENLYGPTELTISTTVHRWDPATSPGLCVNDVVPIGRPHPGMRYRLHDVADGAGELCMTGAQMFGGYLDPAHDEGRFLDADGERWYRTGDLVREQADGGLAYLGRADHQVNLNGVRIELAEIDMALRGCAGVDHAVTVVAGRRLVSYYVGLPRESAALRKELGATLPRPMIPQAVSHLDEWPLNANGKIDRTALAAAAEGAAR